MTRTEPRPEPRRSPSTAKTLAASVVLFVAIAAFLLGLIGLLQSRTPGGLLIAGYVLVGGGVLLGRLAWRLYRGIPGTRGIVAQYPSEEARAVSREQVERQWFVAAIFLAVLTGCYLFLALFYVTENAALGPAAITAILAANLGLASWWMERQDARESAD